MFSAWFELPFQTFLLGMEAGAVIGLRMEKMASGGPAAVLEANQMILEKASALGGAAVTLIAGGSINMVVGGYRTQVRANELRLLSTRKASRTRSSTLVTSSIPA
jgi:hypothetical protein